MRVDESRPYAQYVDMTTAKWLKILPCLVSVESLTLSQTHVRIESVLYHNKWRGEWPPILVVKYGGEMYVEDGHARMTVALAKGIPWIYARVLIV